MRNNYESDEVTTRQLQRAYVQSQIWRNRMVVTACAAIIILCVVSVVWWMTRLMIPVHHCTLVC